MMKKAETGFIHWVNKHGNIIRLCIFLLISLIAGTIIAIARMRSLSAWLYSSDIFSFDTVLQETLRGHIGVEFTFGNTFGEHGYLYIFLLLPLKLLVTTKMTYLLVTLGPLFYMLSAVIFYLTASSILKPTKVLFVSLIYLFGFGYIYRGLFESFYGFHPDTFSGFLAVTFTSFLIWSEVRKGQGKPPKIQMIGFWVIYLLFLSLKEEMALLGAVFFIFVFALNRTRFHLGTSVFSVIFTAFSFNIIRFFQTPFNRTNATLFAENIERMKELKIDFLFNNPEIINKPYGPAVLSTFWVSILLCVFLFLVFLILSKKTSPYVLGLFCIGLLKIVAGVSISVFNIYEWHLFPGLIMLTGAVLMQGFFFEKRFKLNHAKLTLGIAALILLISGYTFLTKDLRFVWRNYLLTSSRIEQIDSYQKELEALKPFIDQERIAAIPPFTAVEWAGYRYSLYPRGVTDSPSGIADYIVYPINLSEKYTGGFERDLPLEETLDHFSIIKETAHFVLLERTNTPAEYTDSREIFFRMIEMPDTIQGKQ